MMANCNFVSKGPKIFFSRFKYFLYLCSSNTGEEYMAEVTTFIIHSLINNNLQLSESTKYFLPNQIQVYFEIATSVKSTRKK